MGRARYADVVTDPLGRPVAGTAVDVFVTGTTTPVAGPLYAAATGVTTLANPFTVGTTGELEFYLSTPARVDLRYSKSGYTSETHTIDVLDAEHAHSGTYGRKRTRLYDLRDYGLTAGVGAGLKAAITSALAAVATDGGGVIYIPGGTYLYDGWTEAAAWALPAMNRVRYVGDDKGTVLRLNPAAPSNPVMLPLRGLKVSAEGLEFDNQGVTNAVPVRILGNTTGARVEGCSFEGTGGPGGIYIDDGGPIADIIIDGNEFRGGHYGVLTASAVALDGLTVSGNTFNGNGGGTDGIAINAPAGTAVNLTISGNTVKGYDNTTANNGMGISVAHAERVTITGNTVRDCGLDGIHVEDSSHAVVVSGNIVSATGRSGIVVDYGVGVSTDTDRTSQVTISNNAVTGCGIDSGTGAIAIEAGAGDASAADYLITGNTVRGCGRAAAADYAGILVGFQSTRTTVAHNHVSNTIGGANAAAILVDSADALLTGNTLVDDQGSPTQKYGIRVKGATSVVRTRDNKFSGNVTAETVVAAGTMLDLNGLAAVDQHALSPGNSTLHRTVAGLSTTIGISSNSVRFGYFTALRSETVGNVRVKTGGTAAGATPTTVQLAVYSVASNGDLTKLAETANDTTLLASTGTVYTKALGSSVALTVGRRYAIGILITTAAATPTFSGVALAIDSAETPWLAANYASAGSFPSSISIATLGSTANVPYLAVLP